MGVTPSPEPPSFLPPRYTYNLSIHQVCDSRTLRCQTAAKYFLVFGIANNNNLHEFSASVKSFRYIIQLKAWLMIPQKYMWNEHNVNVIFIKKYLKRIRYYTVLLTKTTAAQNEIALSYHRVRGLYFLAVAFTATIISVY